jgi:hypothetical protein
MADALMICCMIGEILNTKTCRVTPMSAVHLRAL